MKSFSIPFILIASSTVAGCGGTTTGNPLVSNNVRIEIGTYTAQSWLSLIPSAQASVSGLKLCFKRLRFKSDARSDSSGENIDFTPGEVTVTSSGTSLGEITLSPGTYRRVEFDFEKDCPGSSSGKSIQLTNDNGSFSTKDHITVKFEGTFVATGETQVLRLGMQDIIDALDTVQNEDDIKDKLEDSGTKGSF